MVYGYDVILADYFKDKVEDIKTKIVVWYTLKKDKKTGYSCWWT